MLSVDEARTRILGGLEPLPPEVVTVMEAAGRVLAAPIRARLDNPPRDISAMDGYALRGAEAVTGARLRLIGEAAAGRPFPGTVGMGDCVRVFTGSVIPDGADTVLIQEDADRDGDTVESRVDVAAGRHIRGQGQDFAAGDVLVAPGRRLGARDAGLIAAGDHAWVAVHRRPRIALLATGDELALPGDGVPPGGVVNSNAPMLSALVRAAGAEPILLPLAVDDVGAIAEAIGGLSGADLLVTIGGASVGDYALVQQALAVHGLSLDFWKIAMRPGKPLMHGHVDTRGGRIPVLGLPGNPVSALVCSLLFLIPAVRRLSGETDVLPQPEQAVLGEAMKANDHRADHVRAALSHDTQGRLVATAFPTQDSGMLRRLAVSDALILRAPHAPAADAGDPVLILRLDRTGL